MLLRGRWMLLRAVGVGVPKAERFPPAFIMAR